MSETTREHTNTRTVVVDGREMDADKAASIHEAREIFTRLKKALKTIALYRHNVERYGEYLEPVHAALSDYLERKGSLQLRVDATSFLHHRVVVFEDESRENNIIFPFWRAGIRLLVFKSGLSAEELLRFLLLVVVPEDRFRQSEDIITRLWKAELECIEYIVVEGFKTSPDEDGDEVELEVEKVVAYLYRQLQSNSDDYLRFARISSDDLNLELNDVDQIRGVELKGKLTTPADLSRVQKNLGDEEVRILPKMVVVLFQLLEFDTREETYEDVAEAFVQLLDALLLQENFAAIHEIRSRFALLAQKTTLRPSTLELVRRCGERFNARMAEGQRLQMIAQVLNAGNAKDPSGVQAYLRALGEDAIVPLLEMLEALELPPNRRLVSEVLADLGKNSVPLFASRLMHPASNLVKEVLYVIDRINPPQKFGLFSHVLKHPNAVLRLETLALIGRNPAPECYEAIKRVFLEGDDPQMRAQAARLLPNHAPDKSVPLLVTALQADAFEKRTPAEKKAVFSSLVQIQHPAAEKYINETLDAKSGLFSKKADEMKILAIAGLEIHPSIPVLHRLADIAKDSKKHSKEVCEAAKDAAIAMKAKLLGVS